MKSTAAKNVNMERTNDVREMIEIKSRQKWFSASTSSLPPSAESRLQNADYIYALALFK
jgi:hypothetical protein